MAKRDIIIAPDPRLKKTCITVDTIDGETATLMTDMLETMYAAPGVGLAAPQVGVHKRIIVVDPARGKETPNPHLIANPVIVWSSDETKVHEEGCLSLPLYYEDVTRPDRIRLQYLDENNAERELEADGFFSVVIQHEMDHLDGVLFVDYVSSIKRSMILRKLKKTKKQMAQESD
ncbi:MAG: peptide deformylase [Rhodospirillaceae bacterium]|jgi:peptide deformylase|nr:peptide deformylase [Rhodospirillaceae bacterium]MBT5242309.1 peptide deformylase [Rhodospirillaceae bacterium]MBT5566037.1 peptide deformylase [Rhodospirillaceae bacterium]MBT6089009.1 peptide deformylase [Rhodospirillaceae bacterium]MBT7450131.1 peptide deformylase [Rhodospirillaceae bacterium]